jgi:uncharacterized protein
MQIGITGISGFIGKKLAHAAAEQGHHIVGFSRRLTPLVAGEKERRPLNSETEPDVTGLDAIIHLAGESIMGRWTAAKKERILQSRVQTTQALASSIRRLRDSGHRVPALISASGIGLYGDRGDTVLDEEQPAGAGFLPMVVQAWEREALAVQTETRVAIMRIGIVMGREGGAWPALRRLFRLVLGGPLAGGRHWISWIHIDDLVALLLAAATQEKYCGVYHAVAPQPMRNDEWTKEIARVLHRPAPWPAPAWALRLLMGEQVSIILDSLRTTPSRALKHGFSFRYPELRLALEHLESQS